VKTKTDWCGESVAWVGGIDRTYRAPPLQDRTYRPSPLQDRTYRALTLTTAGQDVPGPHPHHYRTDGGKSHLVRVQRRMLTRSSAACGPAGDKNTCTSGRPNKQTNYQTNKRPNFQPTNRPNNLMTQTLPPLSTIPWGEIKSMNCVQHCRDENKLCQI